MNILTKAAAISGREGAGQNSRLTKRFADIHLSRHAAELKKFLDNRWVISMRPVAAF